ncbi:carbon-nitrogen hydrolase [Vibrio sinensis]|uniref:Carbon-nitrogen hydrolase n=1 Tax=Vibrio sinensis TaxID=2302434 RepID=A0A3A6REV3_9VIBR|nr:nitrilase-related carbon-nitrogen hydrolase [Vibrio sinensis]RJX75662.1 carbon-nitrogen hydrolase [Vibrio sinensis]
MKHVIQLAMIQPGGVPGNVEENIALAIKQCRAAAVDGANFLCLPELFNTGYHLQYLAGDTVSLGEQWHSSTFSLFSSLAKELGVYILCPIVEPTPIPGVVYNSALLFDDEGNQLTSYAKTHLWALEASYFRAGDAIEAVETKFGRVGILICYDIGFPEAARTLCKDGVELLLVPAAWRIQDKDMWDINLRQRALENNFFVAGINATMDFDGLNLFGHSYACNPRGTVIAQMDDKPGYQIVEIALNEVKRYRQEIPYLKDRRPTLYR